jgi:hypothetical protein
VPRGSSVELAAPSGGTAKRSGGGGSAALLGDDGHVWRRRRGTGVVGGGRPHVVVALGGRAGNGPRLSGQWRRLDAGPGIGDHRRPGR